MEVQAHHGPFSSVSRGSPTLYFIERYFKLLESLDFTTMATTTFYAPTAKFIDSKGAISSSSLIIWNRIRQLLTPFEYIYHQMVEITSVEGKEDGIRTVFAEFVLHMRLKNDIENILSPSFCVLKVGNMVRDGGGDGLWIEEVRCFWDTGILGRYITEKKRKEESAKAFDSSQGMSKKRSLEPEGGARKR